MNQKVTALATATQAANNIPALLMDEGELVGILQTSLYPGAAVPSIKMVIGYCRASGLDPMQKPIHIVPMFDKASKSMRDVIMPGVGLYRTQAARSGCLAGIDEPIFGPDVELTLGGQKFAVPEWCKVTVRRLLANGAVGEFTAVEYWIENYATASRDSEVPNAMWKKRRRGQLAKCAQAQALRMAFPEQTGNAPTADEMEGKEIDLGTIDGETGDIRQQAERKEPPPLPAYSDDAVNVCCESIAAGRSVADQVIAKLQTKYSLTEAQKKKMRDTVVAPIEGTATRTE